MKQFQGLAATLTFLTALFAGCTGSVSAAGCVTNCTGARPIPNSIDFGTGLAKSNAGSAAVTGQASVFKVGTPIFAAVHLTEPLGRYVREIILYSSGGKTSMTFKRVRRTPLVYQTSLNFSFKLNGRGKMQAGTWMYRFQHGGKIIAHGSFTLQ